MAFPIKTFALLTLLAPNFVRARNDWEVPCTSGTCSYDHGDGVNHAYTSMVINGGNTAVGDLTTAAGWTIMDCNPDWSNGSHRIRLVCAGEDLQTAHCPHLYQDGAQHTIVRLPQNCGKGPFARVVNDTVAEDQAVPGTITKRAQGDYSQVKLLHLDYDFSQLPASREKVSFALSANNLEAPQSLDARMFRSYRRGRAKRGLFGDITSEFGKVTSAVESVATKGVGAVTSEFSVITSDAVSVATSVASVVTSAVGAAASDVSALANGVNKTLKLGPFNFEKDVTLIDTNIQCDNAKADGVGKLHIDVDTKFDADASFNLEIKGAFNSLPDLDLFTLTGSINGDASATFNMQAALQGTFSTGRIQMFRKALSPLSIPGIITLGPELTIDGDLDMDIDMEADLSLTADWKFPKAQFSIPKGKGPSAGDASTQKTDNPLKLKADANVDVQGTVTAHVIPRLDFGLDVAGGKVKATVFMDVDLGGVLDMDITAKTLSAAGIDSGSSNNTKTAGDGVQDDSSGQGNSDGQVNSNGRDDSDGSTDGASNTKSTKLDDGTTGNSDDDSTDKDDKAPSDDSTSATPAARPTITKGTKPTAAPARRAHSRAFSRRSIFIPRNSAADKRADDTAAAPGSADNSTAAAQGTPQQNNGCIEMSGTIVINVGAQGKFLSFFDDTTQDTIFTKSFPKIFNKCFGGATEKGTTDRKGKTDDENDTAGSEEAEPEQRKRTPKGSKPSDSSGPGKSGSNKPGDKGSLLCGKSPVGLGSLASILG